MGVVCTFGVMSPCPLGSVFLHGVVVTPVPSGGSRGGPRGSRPPSPAHFSSKKRPISPPTPRPFYNLAPVDPPWFSTGLMTTTTRYKQYISLPTGKRTFCRFARRHVHRNADNTTHAIYSYLSTKRQIKETIHGTGNPGAQKA